MDDASDTIQFSHSTFGSWTDLLSHASQSGANTVIHTDATDTLTLQNVTLATLCKTHVQFV